MALRVPNSYVPVLWAPSSLPTTATTATLPDRMGRPLVVGLGDLVVEPLEHHLAHRGRQTHPDRCGQHEHVSSENLLPDARPGVSVTLVGAHAKTHVMVDDADHVTSRDAVTLQLLEDLATQLLRT